MLDDVCSLTGDPLYVDVVESIGSGSQSVGLVGGWGGGCVQLLEILLIRNQAELRKVPSCENCVTSTDPKANGIVFFFFFF